MDNTNNQNKLKLINDPIIFYSLIGILVFMIIMLFIILFNINFSIFGKMPSSNETEVKSIFIILFFTLLIFAY